VRATASSAPFREGEEGVDAASGLAHIQHWIHRVWGEKREQPHLCQREREATQSEEEGCLTITPREGEGGHAAVVEKEHLHILFSSQLRRSLHVMLPARMERGAAGMDHRQMGKGGEERQGVGLMEGRGVELGGKGEMAA